MRAVGDFLNTHISNFKFLQVLNNKQNSTKWVLSCP